MAVRSAIEEAIRESEAIKVLHSLNGEGDEIEGDVRAIFEDISIDGLKESLEELRKSGGIA